MPVPATRNVRPSQAAPGSGDVGGPVTTVCACNDREIHLDDRSDALAEMGDALGAAGAAVSEAWTEELRGHIDG